MTIHKETIGVVSFPRSGAHLIFEILEDLGIHQCGCKKLDREHPIQFNTPVAFHRSHDFGINNDKTMFDKTIICYRNDIESQLYSYFRFEFRNFKQDVRLSSLDEHQLCHDIDITNDEHITFFKNQYKYYQSWKEKWIDTQTPKSFIIEYDSFMKEANTILNNIQTFLFNKVDENITDFLLKKYKIEYKHSLSENTRNTIKDILYNTN